MLLVLLLFACSVETCPDSGVLHFDGQGPAEVLIDGAPVSGSPSCGAAPGWCSHSTGIEVRCEPGQDVVVTFGG